MRKQGWGAVLLVGLMVSMNGAKSLAKPPDLPVDPSVTCPEGREGFGVVEQLPTPTPLSSEEARQIAKQLYRDGEMARQKGDAAAARRSFQEAHLISPTSRPGRLSMRRLQEMEMPTVGSFEEQTEPPMIPREIQPTTDEPPVSDSYRERNRQSSERRFQKMLEQSQSLGLIERAY